MKPLLPPHVGWPLFIVSLLLMSVITSVGTLLIARSDGGAQVVDQYYRKASEWDKHAGQEAEDDALGWSIQVARIASPAPTETWEVALTITDANGAPVRELTGTLRAFRPQWVKPVAEAALSEVDGTPGAYSLVLPDAGAGLWDFEIDAHLGSAHFIRRIRREL